MPYCVSFSPAEALGIAELHAAVTWGDVAGATVTGIGPAGNHEGVAWGAATQKLYVAALSGGAVRLYRLNVDGTGVEDLGSLPVNAIVKALDLATL